MRAAQQRRFDEKREGSVVRKCEREDEAPSERW